MVLMVWIWPLYGMDNMDLAILWYGFLHYMVWILPLYGMYSFGMDIGIDTGIDIDMDTDMDMDMGEECCG